MRNDFEDNYLMHHGIPKMKWGVRNGPPYPLKPSDYSAAEKKAAGLRSTLKNKIQEHRRKSKRYQEDLLDYRSARWQRKTANDWKIHLQDELKKEQKRKKKDPEYGEEYLKGAIAAHDENAQAAQKKIDNFVKRYGDVKLDDERLVAGEKYIDLRLKGMPKEKAMYESSSPEEKRKMDINKNISSNKKEIAATMAKDMAGDIKRWVKEGQIPSMPKAFKNKSDSEIEKEIAKKIEKSISSRNNSDYLFEFSDGTVNFNVDGIPEYSDSQPLTVDYDIKNKKVKNFYYL